MTPINFKVYKTIELDSTDSLKIKHYDICIYDSKNNFLLQIINEVIYDQYFDLDHIDENIIVDINFDGYKDIVYCNDKDWNGKNYFFVTYLYNNVTNRFEYKEDLSELSELQIHDSTKTLTEFLIRGWASRR